MHKITDGNVVTEIEYSVMSDERFPADLYSSLAVTSDNYTALNHTVVSHLHSLNDGSRTYGDIVPEPDTCPEYNLIPDNTS